MTKMAKAKRAEPSRKKPAANEPAAKKERPPTKCPICGEPAVAEYFPFSSKRCAEIDLNRWLSGRYFIPAVETEPDGDIPTDEDEG